MEEEQGVKDVPDAGEVQPEREEAEGEQAEREQAEEVEEEQREEAEEIQREDVEAQVRVPLRRTQGTTDLARPTTAPSRRQ